MHLSTLSRLLASLVLAVLLAACGAGGGGLVSGPEDPDGTTSGGSSGGGADEPVNHGGTVRFYGGTIEDLRELSATLVFDRLEILGSLLLPAAPADITIRVGTLYLDPVATIDYERESCGANDAPRLTIVASGDVDLYGDILLDGRDGVASSQDPWCGACYGLHGGSLEIQTARTIRIASQILLDGGNGLSTSGETGGGCCAGGASGTLYLEADSIVLDDARIDVRQGTTGAGCASGGANPIHLLAADLVQMRHGSVASSGLLVLEAARTDIYGPITYGTLEERIAGVPDLVAPSVRILNPRPGGKYDFGGRVQVFVEVRDFGMGVREIHVEGLGYKAAHSALEAEAATGSFVFWIEAATDPATLRVTAIDNAAHEATDSVAGIVLLPADEAEPNDSFAGAQRLDLPARIAGNVLKTDAGLSLTLENPYGPPWKNEVVQDFYVFHLSEAQDVRIDLDFSESADKWSDLDVILWQFDDTGGWQLTESMDDNAYTGDYTESIARTLSAATYVVGVFAYRTPERESYTLTVRVE